MISVVCCVSDKLFIHWLSHGFNNAALPGCRVSSVLHRVKLPWRALGSREESEGGGAKKYQRLNKQQQKSLTPKAFHRLFFDLYQNFQRNPKNLTADKSCPSRLVFSFVNLCKFDFICFLVRDIINIQQVSAIILFSPVLTPRCPG